MAFGCMIDLRPRRGLGLRFAPDGSSDCQHPASAKREPACSFLPRNRRRWFFLGGILLLTGYLLFCHGCHGDEDNELVTHLSTQLLDGEVAQVGVEPTASLGLSKGGLPIAYRAGALAQRFQKLDGKAMKRFAAANRG